MENEFRRTREIIDAPSIALELLVVLHPFGIPERFSINFLDQLGKEWCLQMSYIRCPSNLYSFSCFFIGRDYSNSFHIQPKEIAIAKEDLFREKHKNGGIVPPSTGYYMKEPEQVKKESRSKNLESLIELVMANPDSEALIESLSFFLKHIQNYKEAIQRFQKHSFTPYKLNIDDLSFFLSKETAAAHLKSEASHGLTVHSNAITMQLSDMSAVVLDQLREIADEIPF